MSKKLTIKKKDNELITKYNKSITISDANLLKLQKAGSMTNYFKSAVKGFKNKATSLQKKVSNKYQATKLRAAMSISQAKESLGKKYKQVKQKAQIASIPYVSKAIKLKDKLKKKTQNAVDLATDLKSNAKRSIQSITAPKISMNAILKSNAKRSIQSITAPKISMNAILKSNTINLEQLNVLIDYYNKSPIEPYTYISKILKIKSIIIKSFIDNNEFNKQSKIINIKLDNLIFNFLDKYVRAWSNTYITFLSQTGGSIMSFAKSMRNKASKLATQAKTAAIKTVAKVKTSLKSTNNYEKQLSKGIPKGIVELEFINKYTNIIKDLLIDCYITNKDYYTKIGYDTNQLNQLNQLESITKVCAFLAYATNLIIPDQKGNITINSISDFINKLNQLLCLNNITKVNITGFDNILNFANTYNSKLNLF